MNSPLKAAAAIFALGLPLAMAHAQTTPAPDPHHPDTPAAAVPSANAQPATPSAPGAAAAAPQMGMMMGDMRQMMGMMRQMMGMMAQGMGQGMGQGADAAMGTGPMMGGGMPMMGMPQGGPDGAPRMGMGPGGGGPMADQRGDGALPGMFRHTDGILAFYKAELRITDAQTPQWNAFADAVRTGAKGMREGIQRAATQRNAGTAPEQLERRVALLTSYLDAAKAVSAAAKALYAALTPEQRKLADEFMTDHMRGMRRMAP